MPYESADSYSVSETFLSGRQSRVGVTAEGASRWGTLRAIFEADFLGVGTTSNDNQSSSYNIRQRIALAEAETKNHWTFRRTRLVAGRREQGRYLDRGLEYRVAHHDRPELRCGPGVGAHGKRARDQELQESGVRGRA